MSKISGQFLISGQFQDSCEISGISGQLGALLVWTECFTAPPTQYRLYERRFLQVKRPNQQYQSTEGTNSTKKNQTYNKQT